MRKMSLQSVTQVAHIFLPPCNILYIPCSPTLLHFQDRQFRIGQRTFHSPTTLQLNLFKVYNTESSFATGPLIGSTSRQRWVLPFLSNIVKEHTQCVKIIGEIHLTL